jgi:hypothetical protein
LTQIWNFFQAHQVLCTLAAGYTWSAFISALPAPTATSTALYRFWFSFFNYLAANIARAQNSKVESSPNFVDAVNIQNAKTGEAKIVVPITPEETKP